MKDNETPAVVQRRFADIFGPRSSEAFKEAFHKCKGAVEAELQGERSFSLFCHANAAYMSGCANIFFSAQRIGSMKAPCRGDKLLPEIERLLGVYNYQKKR